MERFDDKVRALAQRLEGLARRLDGAKTARAADEVRHIAAELAALARDADGEDRETAIAGTPPKLPKP